MGSEATTAASITAAGQIASTGISALAQSNINKKTRKYNLEQYQKERADALSDWNRQNDYNSPTSQMARYRDAGLNPNLIYGQSNTADAVRSTNTAPWSPRAPNIDLNAGPTVSAFYDTRMKEAQIDNLKAQNTVYLQEAALKAATTAQTVQNTAKGTFDLQQAMDLKQISLETAGQNLRNMTQAYTLAGNQDNRNERITNSTIQEAAKRILNVQAQTLKTNQETRNQQEELKRIQSTIKNIDTDSELKQLDINLKKNGLQPGDPIYLRFLGQYLKDFKLPTIEDIKDRFQQWSNPSR